MKQGFQSSLDAAALAQYTSRQLNTFFPDEQLITAASLLPGVEWALARLAALHRVVDSNYYRRDGVPYFDHLHGDQYATYLYWLSRYSFLEEGAPATAAKLYLLNKALHALDIYYEVALPEFFVLRHPVGTVLGRARYGNYLVVSQNCTVGSVDADYPTLGAGVFLGAGATVIGRSRLGNSVCVGAESLLVNFEVPDRRTVVGRAETTRILPGDSEKWRPYFTVAELES